MLSEFAIDPSAIAVPVGPADRVLRHEPWAGATHVRGVTWSTARPTRSEHDRSERHRRPRRARLWRPGHTRRTAPCPGHKDLGMLATGEQGGRDRRRSRGRHRRGRGALGDERGDDGDDAQGGRRRVPGGEPDDDPGEPAAGARAWRARRRCSRSPHPTCSGRCPRGSSWMRWRSTDRSRGRRSTWRTETTSRSWSRTNWTSRPSSISTG